MMFGGPGGVGMGRGRGFSRRVGEVEPGQRPPVRKILGRFWPFMRPYRWAILIGMTTMVLTVGLGKVPPLLGRWLVDEVLTPVLSHPLTSESLARARNGVWLYLLGSLGIGGLTTLFGFLRTYLLHKAGQSMIHDIRVRLYEHLQRLSLSFFENRPSGDLLSRVTGDVDQVEQLITSASDSLLAEILNLVLTLGILLYISWKMTLVAMIPVPLLVYLINYFVRRIRPIYRETRDRMGDLSAKLQENFSGIRVIKAFDREPYEAQEFTAYSLAYFEAHLKGIRLWTWFFPFIGYIHAIGTVMVVAFGAFLALRPQPEATLGDIFAFSVYVGQFYHPIGQLFRIYNTVLRAVSAGERIIEVLDTEPEVRDAPDAIELPPLKGHVRFEDVSFHYQDGEEVLHHINLEALPGQTIALVGRSGAGKTTIINLLARFYDPTQGRVLVDGYDLRRVKQSSLRRQMALVLQDVFLFNGTVKENIRYGKLEATDEEIIEAAKVANAHEFIEKLPQGYETQIGERGVKLSGGQRQRLAIARAILANPRILILDEATSMVDSESEYLIQKALERLLEGRTAFVIAHRLSTVRRADKIVVLEGGRIVEEGPHEELLERGGLYAAMYAMQFRMGDEESEELRQRLRQLTLPPYLEEAEIGWPSAQEGLSQG